MNAVNDQPRESSDEVRCLQCGYPLQPESDYRCPECGAQYEIETLQRWYGGAERGRLDILCWLLGAVLFVQLWIIPQTLPWARLLTAAALGLACYQASQGKLDSIGGYFAAAGGIVSVVMLAFACPTGAQLAYYPLSLTGAALLVLAVIHDADGWIVGQRRGVRGVAMAWLVAGPLLAGLAYVLWPALTSAGVPAPYDQLIAHGAVPALAAFMGWGWAAWTIFRVRRMLFAKFPEAPSWS